MSALYHADNFPGAVVPEGTIIEHFDGAGVYLTDGVFLYRIARLVASGTGDMIELEDCYGLDVVRVPVSGLRARGLRVVTPATAVG
jgi:hypothetical protein